MVNEGAGAGYDITVSEIEIDKIVSVKLGDDKGSWADFEATIKPCAAVVSAEGYYDVFCQDETVMIEGGTISGEVFDLDYFESEEEALEYAKSELEGRLIDIKTMYGGGWMHQYLPEDGDITFKGDLKNTDYYNISAINIKSQEMSAVVNAGHDDVGSNDNEEEEFDESWLGDKVKDGWNKVKDGAKKLGKKIGDAFNGPFRKGDHIKMSGENGKTVNGTITNYDMGDKTYTVLLGNNYDEGSDDSFDKMDIDSKLRNIEFDPTSDDIIEVLGGDVDVKLDDEGIYDGNEEGGYVMYRDFVIHMDGHIINAKYYYDRDSGEVGEVEIDIR